MVRGEYKNNNISSLSSWNSGKTSRGKVHQLFFNVNLFWGGGRKRRGQRIQSCFCTDSNKPDAGTMHGLSQSRPLNRLNHPGTPAHLLLLPVLRKAKAESAHSIPALLNGSEFSYIGLVMTSIIWEIANEKYNLSKSFTYYAAGKTWYFRIQSRLFLENEMSNYCNKRPTWCGSHCLQLKIQWRQKTVTSLRAESVVKCLVMGFGVRMDLVFWNSYLITVFSVGVLSPVWLLCVCRSSHMGWVWSVLHKAQFQLYLFKEAF